jgi:hypothetical protein
MSAAVEEGETVDRFGERSKLSFADTSKWPTYRGALRAHAPIIASRLGRQLLLVPGGSAASLKPLKGKRANTESRRVLSKMMKDEHSDTRPSCLSGGSPLPVLIDTQSPKLRFQRLARYSESSGRSRRSGYPPMGLGKSGFDHFHFTIVQSRESQFWG